MNSRKFIVPAGKKPEIENHFIKLNKRAEKLNIETILWNWGTAFLSEDNALLVPLEINGPLNIIYNGWQFGATIHHLPTGENIFKSILDSNNFPKSYRATGSICEHCKVKRYRKDTYLLFNQEYNEYIQVGSSCIDDFLGNNTPENILNKVNFISDICSFVEAISSDLSYKGTYGFFHIKPFLAQTSYCINKYGWLSKSKAYDNGGKSTASWVLETLSDKNALEISSKDLELAEKSIEWAESLTDKDVEDNDYLYSIRAIVRSGMVESSTVGFAASIIPAYNKFVSKNNIKKESKFVANIKQRAVFNVTVNNIFAYNGSYGTCHKYIFTDQDGNVLFWNASKPQLLSVGDKIAILGTVKAHTEYKNIKQTQLNYCEIVEKYKN